MIFYGRWGSLKQAPSPLANALVAHPKVRFVTEKRFDHAKLYVFDEETMILGGMGSATTSVTSTSTSWSRSPAATRPSGWPTATRGAPRSTGAPVRLPAALVPGARQTGESLAAQRLELIAGARERLTIAMAYLGEPAATDAVCAAVKRGVA